jgi:hypothetical protein
MAFNWQRVEGTPDLPELRMDREAVVVAKLRREQGCECARVRRDRGQDITIPLPVIGQVCSAGGTEQGQQGKPRILATIQMHRRRMDWRTAVPAPQDNPQNHAPGGTILKIDCGDGVLQAGLFKQELAARSFVSAQATEIGIQHD